VSYVKVSTVIQAPPKEVFAYLKDLAHLRGILPEDLKLDLVGPNIKMQKGAEYEFRLKRFGISSVWSTRIEEFKEGEEFVEKQVLGYFSSWLNTYRCEPHGESSTLLTNIVEFRMRFGILGRLADDLIVRRDLSRIVTEGHEKLKNLLEQNEPAEDEAGA
jgi:ligand-binding SRPBCC domain-containing protein